MKEKFEEHEVGVRMVGDRLRRLVEIGRLDDRRLLRQGPQDLAQSSAKQRMVVGDQDTYGGGHRGVG